MGAEANGRETMPFVVELVLGDKKEWEGKEEERGGRSNNSKWQDASLEEGLFLVWDLPLLPDAQTWGKYDHTRRHQQSPE